MKLAARLIEKEAKKYRVALKELKDDELKKIASDYGLGQTDDLMAGIGYGKFSARQVLAKLAPSAAEPLPDADAAKSGSFSSVVRRVFGDNNQRPARQGRGRSSRLPAPACCNPIRGESVVGYVTRGKGVAVHSVNCSNVINLMYEPERRIDVDWGRDEETPSAYPVKLTVMCDDRFGMLKQITAVISDSKNQHPQHRSPHFQRPGQRGTSSSTSPT